MLRAAMTGGVLRSCRHKFGHRISLNTVGPLHAVTSSVPRHVCFQVFCCYCLHCRAGRFCLAGDWRVLYFNRSPYPAPPLCPAAFLFIYFLHENAARGKAKIGGFTPHNVVSGEHVLFLASFHNNDVTLSQFQVNRRPQSCRDIIYSPRACVCCSGLAILAGVRPMRGNYYEVQVSDLQKIRRAVGR